MERFQQTLKNWLTAQHPQPATLAELQALLDAFTSSCNTRRPHTSLPGHSTPAAAYAARPKATPGSRAADTHDRVRTDRIDSCGAVTLRHAGKLYHIGVGRPKPAPASCSWSTTCTSGSSTPPPANCSASSPSTPAATTSPPGGHPAIRPETKDTLARRRFRVSSMS